MRFSRPRNHLKELCHAQSVKLLIVLAVLVVAFWIYVRVKRKAQDRLAKKQEKSLEG